MSLARPRARPAPLEPSFFARGAEQVAREVLGAILVSTIDGEEAAGRIVETEAYIGPQDPASHAAERTGRTPRNRSMFGPPGIAYVYRSYGIHWCLNIVTDAVDHPAAILIRAIEPVAGLDVMRRRRALSRASLADTALASGPGKVAEALGIIGAHDGHPLDRPPLVVLPAAPLPDHDIGSGGRIGVSHAADWPLRFFVRGNPHVSRRRT